MIKQKTITWEDISSELLVEHQITLAKWSNNKGAVYLYCVTKIGLGTYKFILDIISDNIQRLDFESYQINAAITSYNQAIAFFENDKSNVHLSHCNLGDYINSCKYGDTDCPAL
jgi:hypothetical protein